MELEKPIKKTLKFYKKDLEALGILKDGLYTNDCNMLCNFARKAIEYYKQEKKENENI